MYGHSVADPSASRRERDLKAIRATYRRYAHDGRARIWDPGNPGFARMMGDRDRSLVDLLRRSLPDAGGRVLDLGMGDGRLADVAREAGLPLVSWTGVDLDPGAVAAASATIPWAAFVEAAADRLPFDLGAFDVIVTSTLFSSLPSAELEEAVASEVARTLAPQGWLIWYDLRYGNPMNRSVHGLGPNAVRRLFPGWVAELSPVTLIPPLARRLGPLTDALYGPLERLPVLRSHLVGRLRHP